MFFPMKNLTAIYQSAFLLMALFFLPSAGLADSFDDQAREGVTHYNREQYDQAASKFQASQLEQPGNPAVSYNLANSQYRLGQHQDAVKSFKQALTENISPELKQQAHFNMGNAYYRLGHLEKAIDSYKKSLAIKPGDMDSKFNLEWTRQQLEKARKEGRFGPPDPEGPQEPPTSKQPNNPASPNDTSEGSPDKPDRPGEKLDDSQTAENKPETSTDDTNPEQEPPPHSDPLAPEPQETKESGNETRKADQETTPMTPEEAERWLGSISEDLKKMTRRQIQGKMTDTFIDHDKNW